MRRAMGGWSRRKRPLGIGLALASLWFVACALNPHPLPPELGNETPGGSTSEDASVPVATADSGAMNSGSSSGVGSSSGGADATSSSSSGSSSGGPSSGGDDSSIGYPDAGASSDASLADGGDGGSEGGAACLTCAPIDAGRDDAPADGATD